MGLLYITACVAAVLILCYCSANTKDCYGNIDKLKPTGKKGDVHASQKAVSAHLSTFRGNRTCYDEVATRNCIGSSVIAAVASRESNGGVSLIDGYGDRGRAWGIMQCDLKHSGLPCKDCGALSCCHISMVVSQLLVPYIKRVGGTHPSWTIEQQLQGGVAAYNKGVSRVGPEWSQVDSGTTGGDYSNDVLARAQYLKSLGWS